MHFITCYNYLGKRLFKALGLLAAYGLKVYFRLTCF